MAARACSLPPLEQSRTRIHYAPRMSGVAETIQCAEKMESKLSVVNAKRPQDHGGVTCPATAPRRTNVCLGAAQVNRRSLLAFCFASIQSGTIRVSAVSPSHEARPCLHVSSPAGEIHSFWDTLLGESVLVCDFNASSSPADQVDGDRNAQEPSQCPTVPGFSEMMQEKNLELREAAGKCPLSHAHGGRTWLEAEHWHL